MDEVGFSEVPTAPKKVKPALADKVSKKKADTATVTESIDSELTTNIKNIEKRNSVEGYGVKLGNLLSRIGGTTGTV